LNRPRHRDPTMGTVRLLIAVLAVLGLACVAPDAAHADKRVALVIGNSQYNTVPSLPNTTPSRLMYAVLAGSTLMVARLPLKLKLNCVWVLDARV